MAPPPALNWQQRHQNWVDRRNAIASRWAQRHTAHKASAGTATPATAPSSRDLDEDSQTQEYKAAPSPDRPQGDATSTTAAGPVASLRAKPQRGYVDELKHARAAQDEQRTHRRVHVNSAITFTSDSNFFTGITRDISEGGLFIATHCLLTVGSQVDLRFTLPDGGDTISVRGQVRWTAEYHANSDGHPGYGVEFLNLTDADRARIERFVELRESLYYET